MDKISAELMKWMIEKIQLKDEPTKILDIGSLDINGNNRVFFNNPKWEYTGVDMTAGRNVDIVIADPYHYPFADNHFDVVIHGQVMEHVEDIYAFVDETIRVLKHGGWMCITTPCIWEEHKFPLDCWRFYPDGLRWLYVKRTKNMFENIIGYWPMVPKTSEYLRKAQSYALLKKL